MADGRARTSTLNLAEYIPEALDPAGTVVISVRLPVPLAERLDRERDDRTRSEYLRALLEAAFDASSKNFMEREEELKRLRQIEARTPDAWTISEVLGYLTDEGYETPAYDQLNRWSDSRHELAEKLGRNNCG